MLGVDAAAVAAEMVNLATIRDRADPQLIGDAVGVERALAIPGLGISRLEMGTIPFPAA